MKRSGFVLSLILGLGITQFSAFAAPSLIDQTRAQVEAYRISKTPVTMKLKDAPYPKYLIYTQIGEIYPALYADEWEKLTTKPPLDLLFDELIKMILDGTVPDSIHDEVKAIGPRLARNVQKGKSDTCVLDTSENVVKVPKGALLALKLDVINSIPNCTYRKRIFNAAKPALIEARKKPEILAIIKEKGAPIFPAKFKEEFMKSIGDKIRTFPELVVAKFGGEMHPIWGDGGSIIEVTNETPLLPGGKQVVTLEQFGRGLKADLDAAAILMGSTSKKDRGLAAGLFYAAMNRMLMITGGKQIVLEGNGLKLGADAPAGAAAKPADNADKPKVAVPNFFGGDFGGWGAELKNGKAVMSPWDWTSYDPDRNENPTPYRMIPKRFTVDANGVASVDEKDLVQTNAGIGAVISALASFVTHTGPNGAFGKFFGSKDKVSDLLDPAKPLLFPTEGRLFALAILSGMAENLMEFERGHVRMLINPLDDNSVDRTGARKGVWPRFRDNGTFTTAQAKDLDVLPLSRLLRGAEDLRLALVNDEQMKTLEPKVEAIAVDVQNLVQLGILEIVNKTQLGDGTFRRPIYVTGEGPAPVGVSDLTATLEMLLTLFKIYNPYDAQLFYIRIEAALKGGFIPLIQTAQFDPYTKELLRQVWMEIQVKLPITHPNDLPLKEIEAATRSVIAL